MRGLVRTQRRPLRNGSTNGALVNGGVVRGGGRRRISLLGCPCLVLFSWLGILWTWHIRAPSIDRKDSTGGRPSSLAEGLTLEEAQRMGIPIPRNGGGAFVHMGKTGGSTLSLLLKDGCHSFQIHPCIRNNTDPSQATLLNSPASRSIHSYYHVPDFGLLSESEHDFYVMTVRDPFARVVSSFIYGHYDNQLARQSQNLLTLNRKQQQKWKAAYTVCFPTLEHFVTYLAGPDENGRLSYYYPYSKQIVNTDSCPDLAKAALAGRIRIFTHLYFNYERLQIFFQTIQNRQPNKELIMYVNRQEHLWDDWKDINSAIAGETYQLEIPAADDTGRHSARNMTIMAMENKLPVTKELSSKGHEYLCHALIPEYKAYAWFLRQAKNLTPDDVKDSLAEAIKNCPILKERNVFDS